MTQPITPMVAKVAAALAERRRVAPYEDVDLARAAIEAMQPSRQTIIDTIQRWLVDEGVPGYHQFRGNKGAFPTVSGVDRLADAISAALGEKPE